LKKRETEKAEKREKKAEGDNHGWIQVGPE
jgi:hypothetical protein